jgi:hypothetical protein
MFVCCDCCVLSGRNLRRTDHSSRGVLPTVMCLNVIVNPPQWGGLGTRGTVSPWYKNNITGNFLID